MSRKIKQREKAEVDNRLSTKFSFFGGGGGRGRGERKKVGIPNLLEWAISNDSDL